MILIPSRRPIVPRPGWSAATEPAPGRRRRSLQWGRMLAGRAAYTFGDIGGCACGCNCYPCSLPTSNLTLTFVSSGFGTTVQALGYVAVDPVDNRTAGCFWQSACYVLTGGGSTDYFRFLMGCAGSCSFFQHVSYGSVACSGTPQYSAYQNPAGCAAAAGWMYSGTALVALAVKSFTCSPLNIVLGPASGPGTSTWTITP